MQLVEEAIDGGWIGHLARMSAQNSEIGSVYSPPTIQQQSDDASQPVSGGYVETIVEIGHREKVSPFLQFLRSDNLTSCI